MCDFHGKSYKQGVCGFVRCEIPEESLTNTARSGTCSTLFLEALSGRAAFVTNLISRAFVGL